MTGYRREALIEARRRRRLTQEQLADRLIVASSTVKRWERGALTPRPSIRPDIADALGITVDTLDAMLDAPPVTGLVTDLPQHLALPRTPAGPGAALVPVPRQATAADAEQLDGLVSYLEQFDHTAGGGSAARTMAFAQLDTALRCLHDAAMTMAVRARWMQVAARLARLCGFSSADGGHQADAERAFATALSIAREAGDVDGWLNIVCGMARRSLQIGDLRRAMDLIAQAEAGQPPRSAIATSMLHAVRARVFGAVGDSTRALDAVARADEHFAAGPSDDDPPWLWYYDEPQLLGDTGHGLYPLAMQGHLVTEAVARLSGAAARHSPTNARSIAFSTTKAAALSVQWGLDGAEALVERSIVAAATVRSVRLDEDLHDLAGALRRSDTDRATAQLQSIRVLLGRE